MARKKAQPLQKSQAKLEYAQFGTTLKKLIKAKGYTQENFAKAIGVSYSSLMSILKGERRVYLHTYLKMLDVLGVSDLVILNDSLDLPETIQRANLHIKFLLVCEKLPLSTLEHIDVLMSEFSRTKSDHSEETNC